ncbi:phenylalanine--tRNA ligase subunit beta [Clostridium sp. SYSU_GA19001]|uniref:phenylalanine--tRNA ligase subunit beta n=1 Tax=Clostridium caldaquaticum TaxID=2940653 RepID=UPI0020771DF0|nr:phenylalanine--tRNA ligase subunit beta [Clostridium caldaquaticum]MCM8711970.1 phenylalanine--tRNA ligase subunit beta [Clostridium caldaquaticum]
MKVPYKWLKDYVNIDISPKELADRLTLSGSKVEEIITSGDEIQNVVTGKILKIEPHPDAEKLVVCQLDIATGEQLQIVTGANNMKEGDIVPVALHGSSLPNGLKIKKGKLRGVVSNGMMCSEEELGIAGEEQVHGLMILPQDTPIGKDIKEVLGLDNSVIDFEITSNRPDCFSIIGMARETAATLGITYKMPELSFSCKNSSNINDKLKVEVRDAKLCKRYIARGIKNIKIEPSPAWMQERLMQAGVRPINNIVDITNFVMIELGQPMHAFDRREITSNTIVVERAVEGEKFTTLDGVERILNSEVLNIKDGEKTIGLAGIMGGLNSEVKEDTTEIVFECATFDGTNIRISSKNLGLRTEASTKFEKDLDPNLALIAMDRACNLVEALGAGEVMEGTIDIYPEKVIAKTLEVSGSWINKFLGTEIPVEKMKEYLDGLELATVINGDNLVITVPTFRSDVNIKEDVAEEIARIYGYNNIPTTVMSSVALNGGKNKKQKLEDKVIEALIGCGLNQAISYSFVSPKVFDKILLPKDSKLRNAVAIRNPLGEDFSIMRTTSIPSMMEALARNYSRNNAEVRLFEIGKIYIPNDDFDKLPQEKNIVTIGMYGKVDYLDLKGVVENIIDILGINNVSFQRESSNPTFHPGKTAALYVKKDLVGILGEVHPDVSENYEIEERCYIAVLDFDLLINLSNTDKYYKPLPKYPAVTRDLAVLVDEDILVQQIEDIIRKQGSNMVENIVLFDVYKGNQIAEGKKSVAYSITYRLEHKTLTDAEVNKVHDKILRSLEHMLGAVLR